jgi:hypothetical protein
MKNNSAVTKRKRSAHVILSQRLAALASFSTSQSLWLGCISQIVTLVQQGKLNHISHANVAV